MNEPSLLSVKAREPYMLRIFIDQWFSVGKYTWPEQSQGSLKGTYSSSLLYMPSPDLLGLPSPSFSNSIFAILSNNLDRCLWTWGWRTKSSTKKNVVCLEMFTHNPSQHYRMCLQVNQAGDLSSDQHCHLECDVECCMQSSSLKA